MITATPRKQSKTIEKFVTPKYSSKNKNNRRQTELYIVTYEAMNKKINISQRIGEILRYGNNIVDDRRKYFKLFVGSDSSCH